MPTEVQRMPSEQRPYEKLPLSNASHQHNQWAHKEALRVAIGSILAPKRPPWSPGSRSASGTASPYSFPTSQSHTPGTGTPTHHTAVTPFGGAPSGEYLHPHHAPAPSQGHGHAHHHHPYHHQHTHTPSKLVHSVAPSPDGVASPAPQAVVPAKGPTSEPHVSVQAPGESRVASAATTPLPIEFHTVETCQASARPALTPLQAGAMGRAASMPEVQTVAATENGVVSSGGLTGTGRRSPKSKFVEKLQSKSAWDALIHGSFS